MKKGDTVYARIAGGDIVGRIISLGRKEGRRMLDLDNGHWLYEDEARLMEKPKMKPFKGPKDKNTNPCCVCGSGFPPSELTKLDLGKKTWDARICKGCSGIVVRTWLKAHPSIYIGASATLKKGRKKGELVCVPVKKRR
jgi:hypothetical protein